MSLFDQGEFGRGKTFYGPTAAIDSNNLGGADLLGKEKWFTDTINSGSPQTRSKRHVLCRLVRNSSGITLLGKRLVQFKAGTKGTEVDGYTRIFGQGGYAASDEYLPSAGVRANDIFWVVIRGPAIVTTALEGDATNVITTADRVVAGTAAASTGTSAGRVAVESFASATAAATVRPNSLGVAQSAKTTANTGADLLVDIDYHF